MSAESPSNARVEVFERKIVFKTARAMYLLIAVVATLVLVGSLLAGMYGVVPGVDLGEPDEPAQVEAKQVMEADVVAALQAWHAATPSPTPDQPDAREPVVEDGYEEDYNEINIEPEVSPLEVALEQVAAEFDKPKSYPWSDTKECSSRGWRGSCYRWNTKKGARTVLLEGLDSGSSAKAVELVQIAHRLVQLAPQNDDGRFVFLGLFKDLMLATHGQPATLVDALSPLISDREKWSDDALIALTIGLIKAPTMDAGAPRLGILVAQSNRIRETFSDTGIEQAVIAGWSLTKNLPNEEATRVWDIVLSVAATVPDYQRQAVFTSFSEVQSESLSVAAAENMHRRQTWQMDVSEYHTNIKEREASKVEARALAMSGLGLGLMALTSIAVLLAILAVERNTRRVEMLIRHVLVEGGSAASLPVAAPASTSSALPTESPEPVPELPHESTDG
jgi:hypothetical protein